MDDIGNTAAGCLRRGAVAAYRRALIEECCAGAVVMDLCTIVGEICDDPCDECTLPGPTPIAQTIPSLADEVAGELLHGRCGPCECMIACVGGPDGCPDLPFKSPPFAAAYYDAGGKRCYVLVAGECQACMAGNVITPGGADGGRCLECSGTGTRADVGSIARRYGGDGDARVARFEVRL